MKSVLIFRRGSIGDAIVSIPALNEIAKAHPDAERWILTNTPVMETAAAIEDVLKNSMLVQGYINLPRGGGGWTPIRSAIARVRALQPECLYYLSEPSGFLARLKERVFFNLCGIRRIIGAPDAPDTANYRRLATGLWEVRSRIGTGIARVMFTVDGQTMVLLHGFQKKSQRTPPADLMTARRRLAQLRSE